MILIEKKFRIKKITKNGDVWELYPEGNKEPVRLQADLVYGKLPPCRKWPWQCHELTIKTISDKYPVYAEMDGRVLFDIPENEYSEDIKKEVKRIEKIEADYAQYQKQYAETINAQLRDFLPKVKPVAELEEAIDKLPVCWRAYLKLHLPMQYESEENQQRLFLTYHLIRIADRLYRRHTDLDAPLSVVFRSVEFSLNKQFSNCLNEELANQLEKNADYSTKYLAFKEVKLEIERVLPPAEQPLNWYLNQVVHRLLAAYADDYANLVCKRPRDIWGDTINTDHEAYRYLCPQMKLPRLSTLIIEKSFSDAELENANFIF